MEGVCRDLSGKQSLSVYLSHPSPLQRLAHLVTLTKGAGSSPRSSGPSSTSLIQATSAGRSLSDSEARGGRAPAPGHLWAGLVNACLESTLAVSILEGTCQSLSEVGPSLSVRRLRHRTAFGAAGDARQGAGVFAAIKRAIIHILT